MERENIEKASINNIIHPLALLHTTMGSSLLYICLLLVLQAAPSLALVPPLPLAAATTSSPWLAASALATTTTSTLIAATEEYEIAELPPVYVPALFGVALLVGVGVLTGSLGNVMDEEASLGMQSGARAKKEIERSRSSYFKRK